MNRIVPGSCSRVHSLLNAYVDRELYYTDYLLVNRHIASCETCSQDLARYRAVKAALSELPELNSDAVLNGLRQRFGAERRSHVRHAVAVGLFATISAVFAAMLVSGFRQPPARTADADWAKIESSSEHAYNVGAEDIGIPVALAPSAISRR